MKRTFVFVSVFALVAVVATGAIVASKRTAELTSIAEVVQEMRDPGLSGSKPVHRLQLQLEKAENLVAAGNLRKARAILNNVAKAGDMGTFELERATKINNHLQRISENIPVEYTPQGVAALGPDEYELDNDIFSANGIGFRNNGVGNGNQRGRDNSQIQRHTIYPDATNGFDDVDVVSFSLNKASFVRIETNDTADPSFVDTIIGLTDGAGTLLAVNDDAGPGEFNSRIEICLNAGDWFVTTVGFFIGDEFEYDITVDVERPCNHEVESNNNCTLSNDLDLGGTIAAVHTPGVFDGDQDYFTFTLDEAAFVAIATDSIGSEDTILDLYDGCPGNLIASDDDGGPGLLSLIETDLEAGTYYVNVTEFGAFGNSLFPYTLSLDVSEPPLVESESNDNCGLANDATLDTTVLASIDPAFDFDYFLLNVPAEQVVTITTSGSDTVLQVNSADGGSEIACDDDSGASFASVISCCFPAGDYCVGVKAFSSSAVQNYDINFAGGVSCDSIDPPLCTSDPGTFGSCDPFDNRP